jgi:hypothetical protein
MTLTTRRPPRRRERGDAGSASVISIAIVFPAIATLFLVAAQAAMVAAARSVAVGAAEEGLRVARAHHATLTAGRAAAADFAAHEPVLAAPTVTATGTTVITVVVRGHAPALLGLHFSVTGTARGAAERFTVEPTGAGP